jgi:hypothetical protein
VLPRRWLEGRRSGIRTIRQLDQILIQKNREVEISRGFLHTSAPDQNQIVITLPHQPDLDPGIQRRGDLLQEGKVRGAGAVLQLGNEWLKPEPPIHTRRASNYHNQTAWIDLSLRSGTQR